MKTYKTITTYFDGSNCVEFNTEEEIEMLSEDFVDIRENSEDYEISTIEVEWIEGYRPEVIFSL